jgi:hypothetical protein
MSGMRPELWSPDVVPAALTQRTRRTQREALDLSYVGAGFRRPARGLTDAI